MMSKTVILSALIVFSVSVADANPSKAGCETKKKTLEKQLKYAQADKDERLITGLTRTLENIKATCDLKKRLENQDSKLDRKPNNSANNPSPLKQINNKNQSHKRTKNSTIERNKHNKKVQAKQK
ncbi:DUF1090 family protein [Xenorhabdus hominickii]|uniref:DUF1090 domain-containing protein n=1 Tax=Xenorhabdus hominickii TaxID=351679 RepID=A0A2G0QFI9_XENHO|nr:DUF1090 family protein [Xenorhabdus hominickii]AOM41998.1 hypothetical protein A9255_16380 [Xenorhabdus hominickii]PHM57981.1 hypothetical protein Xhom_00985 [Xenorhabdus hominickii]